MKRPSSYVLWSDETCLYVGATEHIGSRLTNHSNDKAWWPDVTRIDVEHHQTVEESRRAEESKILALRPLWNVTRSYTAPPRETHATQGNHVLSVEQTATALNITPRAVRHRIKAGTLAATKLGPGTAAYVITRAEVERAKAEAAA